MKKVKLRIYQLYILIKYVILVFLNPFIKLKEDVWLLSERGIDARDNAYVFYKFLKEKHPNIKVKYVINKQSPDFNKISKEDSLKPGSLKHIYYYLNSSKLISTHIMGFAPEMRIFNKFKNFKLFKPNGKVVFLQHGITSNYIEFLKYDNVGKIDLFISASKMEYEFLINTYGYTEDIVKYTGFARYDNLIDLNEKSILLMPTWRKELFYIGSDNNFMQTDYYQKFNNLINNKKLLNYIEKSNFKLYFYPHFELQKYINTFKCDSKNIILANMEDYDVQDLLKRTKVLVTDYSSVFYDFAYMKKEVIYYQFDFEEFYGKHYGKGNFDFVDNGFGPVCKEENEVVENIIKICKNGIEDKYLERVNRYFTLGNNNNCERIYKEIINL